MEDIIDLLYDANGLLTHQMSVSEKEKNNDAVIVILKQKEKISKIIQTLINLDEFGRV